MMVVKVAIAAMVVDGGGDHDGDDGDLKHDITVEMWNPHRLLGLVLRKPCLNLCFIDTIGNRFSSPANIIPTLVKQADETSQTGSTVFICQKNNKMDRKSAIQEADNSSKINV